MKQLYSSADTSINSTKVPALFKKIGYECFREHWEDAPTVLDYGCGKYDTAKEYTENQGCVWFGYDPFNRTTEENQTALKCLPDIVACANVLNVIDSDEEIEEIAKRIHSYACSYFISVYEGDKSGNWKHTKTGCMQRNEKLTEYLRFFPDAVIRHGVLTNDPMAVI